MRVYQVYRDNNKYSAQVQCGRNGRGGGGGGRAKHDVYGYLKTLDIYGHLHMNMEHEGFT